jgi:DNA adenine methylase
VKPVLHYPGAKWNLAKWIIDHLPPHESYLEPFFGSGAIFFNKQPSHVETINDLNSRVVNFFSVLRDNPTELIRLIELTPWSREEYQKSYEVDGDSLEDARRFLIRTWQAFGGVLSSKVGWRNDVQGRQGTSCAKVWRNMPERMIEVSKRLVDAQIENLPALEVIERFKYKDVLIYADPPYPLSTRAGKMYTHEMTDDDHINLLDVLDQHPGPVILSGYACDLYDQRLKHWSRKTTKAIAEGGRERVEVIWVNPIAAESVGQMTLFEVR